MERNIIITLLEQKKGVGSMIVLSNVRNQANSGFCNLFRDANIFKTLLDFVALLILKISRERLLCYSVKYCIFSFFFSVICIFIKLRVSFRMKFDSALSRIVVFFDCIEQRVFEKAALRQN